VLGAGLATGDQPTDAAKIETFERAEQWLGADEPDRRRNLTQEVSTLHEPAVLDRDPHPHVRGPRQVVRHGHEPVRTLREDLERVLLGAHHRWEHLRGGVV